MKNQRNTTLVRDSPILERLCADFNAANCQTEKLMAILRAYQITSLRCKPCYMRSLTFKPRINKLFRNALCRIIYEITRFNAKSCHVSPARSDLAGLINDWSNLSRIPILIRQSRNAIYGLTWHSRQSDDAKKLGWHEDDFVSTLWSHLYRDIPQKDTNDAKNE